MNFFKRALLSVTRKKGKSLILFAVIFILGNVIAGAIAIQQSTTNVEKKIKSDLGARASIELDYENNQELFNGKDFQPEMLKTELIEKIGQSSYVKYYDYNVVSGAMTKKIKTVKMDDSSFGGGMLGGEYLPLKGVNYPQVLDIQEGKIKLVEGEVFNQAQIAEGKNVAIISSKLADENGLSVGDQLIIDTTQYDYTAESVEDLKELFTIDFPVTIIGLFEPTKIEMKEKDASEKNSMQDQQNEWLSMELLNTIYLPNKSLQEFTSEQNEKMIKTLPDQEENFQDFITPVYVLKSPDDIEAFKQETEVLIPKIYKVTTSADEFDRVGSGMKKMAQISGYVVIIAVIATLIIISLVVLLFMRDRKHELGIYLSLGDKRGHVVGQIVVEMLLISVIALVLSLITGNFLGKMISESLIQGDLLSNTNNIDSMVMYSNEFNSNLTPEQIVDAYSVNFSASYIVTYLIVGLSTVLLSAVLPLVYILRLNPKKIMM